MPGMYFLTSDLVSTSYGVAIVAMLAGAALALLGLTWTSERWRVPVALVGIAMLVSALTYLGAAETWADSQKATAGARYVGWFVVQPLQVAAAYFFARIAGPVPAGVFWRTLAAAGLMVLCRFLGDAQIFDPTLGVLLSIAFWLYILGELYFGAMASVVQTVSRPMRLGYFWIRLIFTIGWAVLPILHFVDVVIGAGHTNAIVVLYNLADIDAMLGTAYLLLLVLSLQIAVAAFAMSGASVLTIELIGRYILPGMNAAAERTSARISLGFIYLAIAIAASLAPFASAVLSPLALSITVQLIPALLGLCWLPWITRGGVLSGLIIATIIVVFTEPAGIIVFERLFVDLPWGRWPLTVHAAAWGLFFNLIVSIIISLFTRKHELSEERRRLHDTYASDFPVRFGGPGSRAAKWSLTLIWMLLAIGPGAILGNTIFHWSFGEATAAPRFPSLLAWQVVSWLSGVLLVWWLAYRSELSVTATEPRRTIELVLPPERLSASDTPGWIAQGLGRLARRSDPGPERSRRR